LNPLFSDIIPCVNQKKHSGNYSAKNVDTQETKMKTMPIRFFIAFLVAIMLVSCAGQAAKSEPSSTQSTTSIATSALPTANFKQPQGVFVNTGDGYGLTYCNLQGQAVSVFKTPGLTNPSSGEVVIAGSVPPGPIQVPIVYIAQNPEPGLKVNSNDQISPLISSRNIFQIAGAPGLPVMAFSRVDDQDNGRTYKLFVGTLGTIAKAPPIVSLFSDKFLYVYNPLAVEADGTTIKGVWYTRTPWGVGGYGFIGNHGLYFYNYATGEIKEYLDDNKNIQGFSPDHSLAVVMDKSNRAKPIFNIVEIKTGKMTTIALDPGSDNGGGGGEFSPDNRYLAWMESSGTNMSDTPDFRSRLRVAQLGAAPSLVVDLTDEASSKIFRYSEVQSAGAAGWLDNQTLLVNTNGELKKLDVVSGKFTSFCKGSFVAFAYQ
jgi:hypothetical protein